jgi:hypothetical protein
VKTVVLPVALLVVLIAGCGGGGKEYQLAYIPPVPKESFSIGAFKPSKTEYNFKHYDGEKVAALLASVNGRFSDGDIVAVDGLKWQKNAGEWAAIPNPPIPVLKPGDDVSKYLDLYAEWIEDHPHFGYPPLPLGNKK